VTTWPERRRAIARSVGPGEENRDLLVRAIQGWCQQTFGCGCTACWREWLRLKVLTPNGWDFVEDPEPQDERWHLRDARKDDLRSRVRRIFG
jgi:hypothetical protein